MSAAAASAAPGAVGAPGAVAGAALAACAESAGRIMAATTAAERRAFVPRARRRGCSGMVIIGLRGIETSVAFTLKKLLAQIGPATDSQDVRYVEEPSGPNPFLVYDRAGERCPRCRRGTIARLVQEGRSTFYCPECQR